MNRERAQFRDQFKTDKYDKFFKALVAKLKLEITNPIKKTILEMYIKEKEDEYFRQHEQEFFEFSSEYYFHFIEKQDKKTFDIYEEKNKYWFSFVLANGGFDQAKRDYLIKHLRTIMEKCCKQQNLQSFNFSLADMEEALNFVSNCPIQTPRPTQPPQIDLPFLISILEESRRLSSKCRDYLNSVCKYIMKPPQPLQGQGQISASPNPSRPGLTDPSKNSPIMNKPPQSPQNPALLPLQLGQTLIKGPLLASQQKPPHGLQPYPAERKGQGPIPSPFMESMAQKQSGKRPPEEFEDPLVKAEVKKKIRTESLVNSGSSAKKDKVTLTKFVGINAFLDTFGAIVRDYPDLLKVNIEKTLNELKSEGYIVYIF